MSTNRIIQIVTKEDCEKCEDLKKSLNKHFDNADPLTYNVRYVDVGSADGMSAMAYFSTLDGPLPMMVSDDGIETSWIAIARYVKKKVEDTADKEVENNE